MSVGDVYELSIPPALAFGTKGRRASAGKPSIPAGAYVTVRMTVLCCRCGAGSFFHLVACGCGDCVSRAASGGSGTVSGARC